MALFGRAFRLDQGPYKPEPPPKEGGTEQVRSNGGIRGAFMRKSMPRTLQVLGATLQQIDNPQGQLDAFSANEADQQRQALEDMALARTQKIQDGENAQYDQYVSSLDPQYQPLARLDREGFLRSQMPMSAEDRQRSDFQERQFQETQRHNRATEGGSGGARLGREQFSLLTPAEREEQNLPPGTYQRNNATGQITVVGRTRGQYTEGASSAAQFASRMSAADRTLTQLERSGVDRTGIYIARYSGGSQDERRVRQAQREFVNAILRRESGAVISPEEFGSAELQYFPVPGDGPQVIEQKRQARQRALQGLVNASQGAYEEWYGDGSGAEPAPLDAAGVPVAPTDTRQGPQLRWNPRTMRSEPVTTAPSSNRIRIDASGNRIP